MAKVINPKAAGIDIAAKEHFVCVPNSESNNKGKVKSFGSYTKDLYAISAWLKENEITTVAMESTGIYWMELFFVLKEAGFEVLLVDARHIKNVPGRKTDVLDAQWIQKLHSYGFLRGCYQPENLMRTLRTLVRRRSQLIKDMTTSTNRLVKALEQMNLKTKQVISDIHGKTGRAIIQAIIGGERKAKNFLKYKDRRIKASDNEFQLALEGNWKEEQLYLLELENNSYKFLKNELSKLDAKIEVVLKQLTLNQKVLPEKQRTTKSKNAPKFNVKGYLQNLYGVDVTKIYGIKEGSALTILSETGKDLKKKFPAEKQFLSWLNLVPDTKISGGKVLSNGMKKKKNKAGQAFREASGTLWRSKNPLGEKLRSKKAKKGAGPAIVSIANKLASIYYNMVTKKLEFEPGKLVQHKKQILLNRINYFERKANEMRVIMEKEVSLVI